ncbi:hypothetical protein EBR16_00945 [bacterium]|nr:hypothetical protein [bacterium]
MRNALCFEAFGTFFLCLAAAVAGEPLAVAAVLCALIYVGGPVSGAHYNPASTLAWCVRGRHRWLAGVAYVLVQLTVALAAAAVAGLLAGHDPERTAAAARAIDDPVFEGVCNEGRLRRLHRRGRAIQGAPLGARVRREVHPALPPVGRLAAGGRGGRRLHLPRAFPRGALKSQGRA